MARLLVASVVVACALCQSSACGAILHGQVTSTAMVAAPEVIIAGGEFTLSFSIETEYPYHAAGSGLIEFTTPSRHWSIGTLAFVPEYGFWAGTGLAPNLRFSMGIPAVGLIDDPSLVLTGEMLQTVTLTFSHESADTNHEFVNYTILQDAPISWHAPEPGSFALAMLALVALLLRVRRK